MIAQIDDENVMSMCLIVNDDLHKTFERYRAIKKGRRPEKFVPGEDVQNTALNPSHIYTSQTSSSVNAEEARQAVNEAQAAPSQPAGGIPPPKQPQQQPPAADIDLFDMMGGSNANQQ